MRQSAVIDRATGLLAVVLTVLVGIFEWGGVSVSPAIQGTTLLLVLLLSLRVSRRGVLFVAVAVLLTVALFTLRTRDEGLQSVSDAAYLAGFIAAFFVALASLQEAAETSPAIRRCGRFLAQQPPGRRYAALTVGGQLFSLVLNYGSLVLLGSLALASASEEANVEVRRARVRRMLLAIQRGFVSVLPWSPLSFAIAVTTTLIPGTSWGEALLPCLVTGALLASIGYVLDILVKPKITGPRSPLPEPEGTWATVLPLLGLLAVLLVVIGGLRAIVDVRVPGIVLVVVPLTALAWIALQSSGERRGRTTVVRSAKYVLEEIPSYRDELTLLMMAGYLGTVGADLLVPLATSAGLGLGGLPAVVILVAFVWIIPLAGQLGMNPILAVSLVAPLVPSAAELGVSATSVLVAITAGWALAGASSPFTATTLLVGSYAGISATRVGLRWNGLYSLLCALVLSGWVLVYAFL